MIQAVIFDIGGVLAHDVWEHLFLDDDGLSAKYPQLERDAMFQWGKRIWGRFAYTPETPHYDWRALECQYWEAFLDAFQDRLPGSTTPADLIELSLNFFRPVEGMNALLQKLRAQHLTLGICSDNNEFWYRRQADCAGFDKIIDSDKIVLSNRVSKPKRSAQYEMFEAVTRAVGVPKPDCVFVDDRVPCLERALEFGLTGILFPAQAAFGAQYIETLIEKMQPRPRLPHDHGRQEAQPGRK